MIALRKYCVLVVRADDDQYVTGHLSAEVLAAKYKPIEKSRWQGYLGPCYEPK